MSSTPDTAPPLTYEEIDPRTVWFFNFWNNPRVFLIERNGVLDPIPPRWIAMSLMDWHPKNSSTQEDE